MKYRFLDYIILSPFYWLFTGFFFVENADKKLVIFVLISLLFTVIRYGTELIITNIKKPLCLLLIITSIYLAISGFINGGSSQEVRVYLVMLVLFISFPRKLLTEKTIDNLLILGSIAAITFILYNKYILGIDRAVPHVGGGFNPIPYSSTLSIFGLISVHRLIKSKKITLLISLVFLSAAILFTQTRGVILSYFILIPTFILLVYGFNKNKIAITTVILLCISFFGYKMIENRIKTTVQEIQSVQDGVFTTSIGLRIQFINVALQLIKEKPIFGFGDRHAERLQELYHEGKVSHVVAEYSPTSYHNQHLDTWVKKGVIGLILLLILQVIPVIYAYKYQTQYIDKVFALCLVALFMGICIAGTPFRQALPMAPILFSIYYCLSFTKIERV
ncbi:hypothetical protein GL178_10925 [Vibrio toranzoniae]|uniref:O-antigen ligase family protein n=1 Tax=Vibrio toranzoniae TaxID=1194427 RepID=UPI001378AD00|nr:O-antigen ligase family protein [Vibrio toranzoniae]NAZ46753.1 hypothetical protein [Vibrio toranzoniae]